MHQALRPYVTSGVALVGASVIAVAPIAPTPPDIHLANPVTQAERAVQLTANEIEDAVNKLVFAATKASVSVAQLTTPLVAKILGVPEPQAAAFLTIGTIGLLGPFISGTGAVGTALQDIVDSNGLEELLTNLIGAPGTIVDGVVNGDYGPDLASLAIPALILLGKFPSLPPVLWPEVLAGGLINPGGTVFPPNSQLPSLITLPGQIPTLQGLVEQLFGLFHPAAAMNVNSVNGQLATAPDATIEDGINSLLFTLTKATLHVVELATPVAARILDVPEPVAAAFLALGTVGLLGPAISGTGAVGTALQDIVNSHGVEELLTSLIGAPGIVTDGLVNGGYGPNLLPLLPALQAIPGATKAFAPGLIENPGFIYGVVPGGIGIKPTSQTTLSVLPPGTIAVLQGLVERVFGALPGAANLNANTLQAPAGGQQDLKINGLAGDDASKLTLSENSGADVGGLAGGDGPEVKPKKHRPRVELNVLKLNPLDQSTKDGGAAQGGNGDGGTSTAKHRPGAGLTPVRDLVKKVLGGGHDDQKDSGAENSKEPAAS